MENVKSFTQKGITPCACTDWGTLGKQHDGKRRGAPGESIKLVDNDYLISRRPLFKQNLNRNLNRNFLFYVF